MNQHIRILCTIYSIFICSISIAQKNNDKGGILLTDMEIKKIFPSKVLKQIGVQLPISKVYSFEDKNGKQYLIFTEDITRGNIQKENNLKKSIKAFKVYFRENKDIKVRWTITDFIDKNEESIWFWTRYLNLKDLDNDGFIDPIIVYGTKSIYGEDFEEARVKILIYHLEKKIAIRHQNSELDDGRYTQVDKNFDSLPFNIKEKVYDIIVLLEDNGHSLFNTELKNQIRKSLKMKEECLP
ncbi:M949_RS01915 family surface polysaccharide biosynthesis protein [Capnocytophaga cynodegmi]|uniref:M949_RS01915 family surface polysaccharide biosynthesis protein n=1 Tax=Capnocytophaga cynodegmi TaxID=28189 RepID=UPI0038597248